MSDNWVVSTLEDALNNWNNKLAEIWSLVSQTPESFRGGEIWTVIVNIHNALVGFGYGLLVLFFAMGVFRSACLLYTSAASGTTHPLCVFVCVLQSVWRESEQLSGRK